MEQPPARRIPLTQTAHRFLQQAIEQARGTDTSVTPLRAIDATAGNGHDTLFLAQLLGKGGEVAAFDIQLEAIENTRQRLQPKPGQAAPPFEADGGDGLQPALASVRLVHASHAEMLAHLPADWLGSVTAITFNLGYLPGGDKAIVTLSSSTLAALEAALQLLAPDGLISALCYRGHSEGAAETEALRHWLESRLTTGGNSGTGTSNSDPADGQQDGARFSYRFFYDGTAPAHAPLLLHIRRAQP